MHFDDRLATVLRHRAAGERAAKTQFRQLLDLLGERPQAGDPALKAAAYLRLIALAEVIPVADRAAIVGENGWRFRNPELVRWFGEAHPAIAGAALYRAQLTGEEWAELIPRLPIRARGFLRHRTDLPTGAIRVLDRLGVSDRALPVPNDMTRSDIREEADSEPTDVGEPEPLILRPANENSQTAATPASADQQNSVNADGAGPAVAPVEEPAPPASREGTAGKPDDIRSLVERIESFRKARGPASQAHDAPTLPMAGLDEVQHRKPIDVFSFGTNSEGRIDWAEPDIAPMVVGIDLSQRRDGGQAGEDFASAFINRQPARGVPITLYGATAIEGDWIVDAAPRFTRSEGRFYGYVGRFRRAIATVDDRAQRGADRLRQLLHELRTPVNAMQGYAEVIQQQVFGPTPHEYRALAASIAGDSARILAGFDELDRLARLETGALDLEAGESDFANVVRAQLAQLQTVLGPRVARFDARLTDRPAPLALAQNEAEMLGWRVLATLAGATGAGENLSLTLALDGEQVTLRAQLPTKLAGAEDVFSSDVRSGGSTLSSGIFGAGFSLRLARAEARAAGGELAREENELVLSLPLLTGAETLPSPADAPDRAAG
ncbi:histidine kinase dimerization/phospho-acceptor domain-containing protein [Erythrobacter sp.]|uniref:sensor histidine kinase n=1 Tax=Erythrobacter sp. TaxID=1042 RepID=UPI001B034B72|nr:histidine kinase dimerization/phospho-acceptor domain-containing protein [Erythrobacter sp.]MBO6527075.1 sensor histidine kinase [Erythrobacter sp.]MBO6528955.1 sensor histidine kinase [Erythrobacter sp.]